MTAPNAPTIAQLLSGGGKYFPFKAVGDSITGIIETVHDPEPQTDVNGAPVLKPDGTPKYQFRIDLQTDLRNDEDDDGKRTLYAKAWMFGALTDAIRAAGATGLNPGARLTVACIAQDPPPKPHMRPVNKYAATYEPAPAGASASANALLGQQGAPAPAQQQSPVQQPVQQQAPAAAAAPPGPPPGVTAEAWARMDPATQAAILAANAPF